MQEQFIKDFIKDKLGYDAKILYRLMGGMSNYTYVLKFNGEKYTFRVPGKGAEHFVNREVELENIKHIASLQLMPEPILFEVDTGYKIAPFVEGIPLHESSDKHLNLVKAILEKIHGSQLMVADYDSLKRLTYYESINDSLNPFYLELKNKWLELYKAVLSKVRLVPCHGDSQTSNFVFGNGKLYLMDWEFAGNNDPLYDVACFGNANFDDALNLLNIYSERPTQNQYQRLYGWRMFQCLQWHNVAVYKHKIGLSEELSLDFNFFCKVYLDKANYFYQEYLKYKG